MTQSSGPISQGTDAERQMTDALWRDLFGGEAGVVADYDGTAYALTLPSDTDDALVGSVTQASLAVVAGFSHKIPSNSREPITIPDAVGSSRTDVLALRYDPSFTGLPGPVRLVRIAGSSSAIPSFDDAPPGVEDLPLWAITRAPGQLLSQATTVRMFSRIAPTLEVAVGASLPASAPLGTVLQQGAVVFYRRLVGTTPTWVRNTYVQSADPGSVPDGTIWFQV